MIDFEAELDRLAADLAVLDVADTGAPAASTVLEPGRSECRDPLTPAPAQRPAVPTTAGIAP